MSRVYRYSIVFFLLVAIMVMSLPCGSALGNNSLQTIRDGFQKMSENGLFVLYADKTSGEFYVSNKLTGDMWWSNPPNRDNDSIAKGMQKMDLNSQLIIRYVDTVTRNETLLNNFTGSVNKNEAVLSKIDNGFQMEYSFPQKESKINMEVRLNDDYIEVTVPVDKIVEAEPNNFYSISVLPYFGAGSNQDDGYLFVPDGSGALIYYNNGKQSYDDYRQNIYGNDLARNELTRGSVQQDIRMPVYGAQNGSCGYLAVVTEGDALGAINARVSGAKSSYNTVYCEFSLRTNGIKNLGNDHLVTVYDKNITNVKKLTIRYYLLSGKDCDYNAMASKYREYLVDIIGMHNMKAPEDIPLYIELYGAIRKNKNILGIPVTVTAPLTDYESALDLVKKIKGSGINNIVLKYTNSNKDNVNGTYLSSFHPESKLGSRKQLNDLISYCTENNIIFAPNSDLLYFKKGSLFGVSKFADGVREITGMLAARYKYKLSTDRVDDTKSESYLMTPGKINAKVNGFIKSIKKVNVDSISLDTLGKNLYSDFYKNRSGRQQSLVYMQDTAKSISDKVKDIIMSDANAYMLPYARYVEDTPQYSSQFSIIDDDIPFYQLSISGLVSYSTPAANLGSDPQKALLKAIENGSSLKYTWITGDPSDLINTEYMDLYGTDSAAWLESAEANYKMINEVYKRSEGTQIIRHRIISKGVRETMYANGVRVIVNYNDTETIVDENNKVAPKSFIIK